MNIIIIFIIILIAIFLLFESDLIEAYTLYYPYYFPRFSYWNIPTRNTWNMSYDLRSYDLRSYDLRGDYYTPYNYIGPWNIATRRWRW